MCVGKLDVVFVLDSSGSIQDQPDGSRNPRNWNLLKSFVTLLSAELFKKINDVRVAQVVFSDRVHLHFSFLTDPNAISTAVDKTPYYGSTTNIAGGLQEAIDTIINDLTPNRRKLIILITDGEANVNANKIGSVAKNARDVATIMAVGITDAINNDQLMNIVGFKASRVIKVDDFDALAASITPVTNIVCTVSGQETGMLE